MKSRRIALYVAIFTAFALISAALASSAVAEPSVTFTVNASSDFVDAIPGNGICETPAGNGMCTLRAAIMEANAHIGADTIYLPSATYHLTIPGAGEEACATGDLNITEALTIIGDQNGSSTIDANGLSDRALQILPGGGPVSISYVTVKNGSTNQHGGGIYSSAALNLYEVYIFHNHAQGYGGGIDIIAPLTMISGNIEQNSADTGGGMFAASSLRMENVLLSNNSARLGGGLHFSGVDGQLVNTNFFLNTASDSGGAIYNNQADLTLIDSTFASNSAALGGGIFNGTNASLSLSRVSLLSNEGSNYGGGIQNHGGSVIGQKVLFDQNTSTNGFGSAISNTSGNINFDNTMFSNNDGDIGGAINNSDVAFITNSTVISNTSSLYGGGIFNNGNLNLKGVTVHYNSSRDGGGIYNIYLLAVTNSTVSGNISSSDGAGIFNSGTAFVNSSTITSNITSFAELTGYGGGVYNQLNSTFIIRNTILYGNFHTRSLVPYTDDCYGTLNTQHYNLIGTLVDCSLNFSQDLDQIGANPLLGDLEDNGGPTLTYALLDNSPAIDGGNPNNCYDQLGTILTKDQRGYPRTWDGDEDGTARCDIGAYEFGSNVRFFLPITMK